MGLTLPTPSFDDDFNTIAPAILEADAVVFSMPVYWYSIPAQIKGVIDRLFSFVVGGKDIAGKECAVIACCEEDDMSVFDGVRVPIERSAALTGTLSAAMSSKATFAAVDVHVIQKKFCYSMADALVGDIAKTDGCKQAAALAEKF